MKNSNQMKIVLNKAQYLALASAVIFSVPNVAFGVGFSLSRSNFGGVIGEVLGVIGILNPILIGLSVLAFFWGLAKFILNSGNKDGIATGRDYMLWGVLALFILFSVRTIIGLVSTDLDIGGKPNESTVLLPER